MSGELINKIILRIDLKIIQLSENKLNMIIKNININKINNSFNNINHNNNNNKNNIFI